jgi:hypothetical protein
MAHYLTKEDLLHKLAPFGIKKVGKINGLIREQGLPAKYFSPRNVYFEEEEVDTWMSKRTSEIMKANTDHIKALRVQRKKRKGGTSATTGFMAEVVPLKKTEA